MNENQEIVKKWIEKADHDLGSAKLIYLHLPEYFDTIAFHCQQAAEKYLKALLVFYDIEVQKTHNLMYLLDLLSRTIDINKDIYDKAILLNSYSIQIRYPEEIIYLTNEELTKSIQISEEFRDFVKNIID